MLPASPYTRRAYSLTHTYRFFRTGRLKVHLVDGKIHAARCDVLSLGAELANGAVP